MREKTGYRDILADLLEHTGGKRLIDKKTAAAYLGIDPRTAGKRYFNGAKKITAPEFARRLCT